MIDNLDEAITHAREKAKELRRDGLKPNTNIWVANECLECAKEHERLADWLTELKERREAVKKLEETAEYYKDNLFGDGIRFALKVIGEPRKHDWESKAENED